MPAAPELLRIHRLVGRIEVLGQVEAKKHGYARGDVRVAGEVCIHLQRVAKQGAQVLEAAVEKGILKDAVGKVHGQVVGQDEFLHKTVHDPEDGNAKPAAAQVVGFVQLLNKLHGPHDGAGNQLGEETQVKAKVQEVLYRFYLFPLHIHYVTHSLEGEEGDAYGEDDGVYPEEVDPGEGVQELSQDVVHLEGRTQKVVYKVREEVGVFEVGQDAQVYDDAEDGKRTPCPVAAQFP